MVGEKCRHGACRASMGAFALLIAGCAGNAGEMAVQPLEQVQSGDRRPAVAAPRAWGWGRGWSGSEQSASSSADSSPTAAESEQGGDPVLRAEVGDLLERYDLAFAGLAGDPLKAHDDTSAPVVRWHEVVLPGSALDIHVRAQLLVDAQDNRVLYEPDSSGVLLVSHASELSADPDGSLTWRHCAFTPWIEVDADSGALVDDRPFQRWGAGRAVRRGDGSLAVAELSEDELVELPATSDDRCTTAEAADSTTDGREVGP